jgi:hypothetical protein
MDTSKSADFITLLKMMTVQFISEPRDGELRQIGSGFIIGATNGQILLLTAAHNLQEIKRIDDEKNYVPVANVVNLRGNTFWQLKNTYTHVVFMGHDRPYMLQISRAWWNGGSDVACVLVEVPEDHREDFKVDLRLGLDTTPPHVGEEIHAYGYTEMATLDQEVSYGSADGRWRMTSTFVGVQGEVLEINPQSSMARFIGPCFRINVPISSGMSGGYVTRLTDDGPRVCGVLCSDVSSEESAGIGSGHAALAAQLWPIVDIQVDASEGADGAKQRVRLKRLFESRLIDDLGRAHEKVTVVDNGDGTRALTYS